MVMVECIYWSSMKLNTKLLGILHRSPLCTLLIYSYLIDKLIYLYSSYHLGMTTLKKKSVMFLAIDFMHVVIPDLLLFGEEICQFG